MTHCFFSHGRCLAGLLLVLGLGGGGWTISLAGEDIHFDRFERFGPFVDVTVVGAHLCVIDGQSNLRCSGPPGRERLPRLVRGDFIDLAGTVEGVCARRATGEVQCWGESRFGPDPDFAAAIPLTHRFLPDLPNNVCAHDDEGRVRCLGAVAFGEEAVTAFAQIHPNAPFPACWLPVDGGMQCDDGETIQTFLDEETLMDVAIMGSGSTTTGCGLLPSAEVSCWRLDGAFELAPQAPIAASGVVRLFGTRDQDLCGQRADGRLLCFSYRNVMNPTIYNSAWPYPLASVERFEGLQGVSCGLEPDGRLACWGGWATGSGLAQPGSDWVSVQSEFSDTSWRRGDERVAMGGFLAGDTSRSAAGMRPARLSSNRFSPNQCGLKDGEFHCMRGTNQWGVPAGPWEQVALSSEFATAWCGLRPSGEVVCGGAEGHEAIADVPAGTFQQIEMSQLSFLFGGNPVVLALGTDGRIYCWMSTGDCPISLPDDTNVVRIPDTTSGFALLATGERVNLSSGERGPGILFERYSGQFGFRANDTIAWWQEPDRPVPSGPYLEAVDLNNLWIGPRDTVAPVRGCGLRPDGGVDCWGESGGQAVILAQFDDDFTELHRGFGLYLTRADGRTEHFGSFGAPMVPVLDIYAGGLSVCMIDANSVAGCRPIGGPNPFDTVNQSTGAYAGLAAYNDSLCAISDVDELECWTRTESPPFEFAGTGWSSVVLGPSLACGAEQDDRLMRCQGPGLFNPVPDQPFALLPAPQRDMAISIYSVCRLNHLGALECFALSNFFTGVIEDATGPYRQIELASTAPFACLIREGSGKLECYDTAVSASQTWRRTFAPAGQFVDVAIGSASICAVTDQARSVCWGPETMLQYWNANH